MRSVSLGTISKVIKAYLDSCIIISLIEGAEAQQQLLKQNLAERSIFSSELARLETQIVPTKQNDKDSLQQLERFFAACKMTELNRAAFDQAIQLRVKSKLKTPDAIYLSAAIVSGCQEFWTDDKQLKSIVNKYLKAIGCEDMQKTALDLNSDERKNESE